jgi:phosphatidate cytidylyltransferase
VSVASARALADIEAGRTARWADLRLRVASALVLAPVALACVWFGGIAWYALVVAAGLGVCWEWSRMCRGRVVALLAGLGYVVLAMVALAWLRADPAGGRPALIFLVAVVWCSDIGAYLAGRLIGGRKLAPSISPGKTWSGAAGGLLAAVAGAEVVAALWNGRPGPAMLAAIVLGVASQLGDLLESAVKRRFGVKDSSHLIPGHGGLLDRLDGLMAAAVVAGGWAWVTGQGGPAWQ